MEEGALFYEKIFVNMRKTLQIQCFSGFYALVIECGLAENTNRKAL